TKQIEQQTFPNNWFFSFLDKCRMGRHREVRQSLLKSLASRIELLLCLLVRSITSFVELISACAEVLGGEQFGNGSEKACGEVYGGGICKAQLTGGGL